MKSPASQVLAGRSCWAGSGTIGGMKRWMQVLAVAVCVALAGCSSPLKPSLESVQSDAQRELTRQARAKGSPTDACTKVDLVDLGDDKYSGVAYYSDGSKRNITATADLANGKLLVTPE